VRKTFVLRRKVVAVATLIIKNRIKLIEKVIRTWWIFNLKKLSEIEIFLMRERKIGCERLLRNMQMVAFWGIWLVNRSYNWQWERMRW
jgi:hypothetical protein